MKNENDPEGGSRQTDRNEKECMHKIRQQQKQNGTALLDQIYLFSYYA